MSGNDVSSTRNGLAHVNALKHSLKEQGYTNWEKQSLLEIFNNGGPDGVFGVEYITKRNIHIKVGHRLDLRGIIGKVSAWYVEDEYIVLNPRKYSLEKMPDEWGLSLIVHEAKHIEQGVLKAFSIYGELEAWQVGIRVAERLGYNYAGRSQRNEKIKRLPLHENSVDKFAEIIKENSPGYYRGLQLLPRLPNPNWLGFKIPFLPKP